MTVEKVRDFSVLFDLGPGSNGIGKFAVIFKSIWEFSLLLSTYKQMLLMDLLLHCILLCITIIFECPRYL